MQLMNQIYFGAALLTLLIAMLPALDNKFKPWGDWEPKPWRSVLHDLWASETGAVSVTYYARNVSSGTAVNGSTTPPTTVQANYFPKQTAVVVFGVTADVQALFTHNWGLDNSAPGYFEPLIQVWQISDTTAFPSLTFDVSNTNVVKINKAASNAPVTVVVTLRNPDGPWA